MRAWAVARTLDVRCCLEAREQACRGGRPEGFTTDPGAPCTSQACTTRLQERGVRLSREGRGRALDHVWVERLWRRGPWQAVYLRDDQRVGDARQRLARYVGLYHAERLHQALGYRTPAARYLA